MVAIAYSDINAPARPAPRAAQTPKRAAHRPISDPVVDVTTRLLSVPLRQVYAALWRVGLLVVDD